MAFTRPVNSNALSKEKKLALLKDYVSHYEHEAALDPTTLNRKVPREAFSELLDRIGSLLLQESRSMATEPGRVYEFLHATPLPSSMESLLPRDFRVYCLALNALKQWVSAEQAATDRFLLGGTARELCRSATSKCIVTGEPLGSDLELHHPVRDGRPPLPLSKHGHDMVEGQVSASSADPVEAALISLKREGNRSWAMLRRGCLDLLGTPLPVTSQAVAASSRTFARKAAVVSKLSYAEILAWLDANSR
ncbi:MAG: hypothetical protein QOE96_3059 [Blastocatellia bacterium]|jgi:hypothetical protein|nr:hypothetical protein [Blastocatellia bacterium]